jgi:oxygen-independent coproporphyrinogen-3 oxidase
VIERLMCDFVADVSTISVVHGFPREFLLEGNSRLRDMADDGIVAIRDGVVTFVSKDRFMIRAVASTFDAYLADMRRTFSKAAGANRRRET